jgi:hypothetical protein
MGIRTTHTIEIPSLFNNHGGAGVGGTGVSVRGTGIGVEVKAGMVGINVGLGVGFFGLPGVRVDVSVLYKITSWCVGEGVCVGVRERVLVSVRDGVLVGVPVLVTGATGVSV